MDPLNRNALPRVRDPAVDRYRVAAIVVVVAGHWLAASLVFSGGRFADDNVLTAIPWAPWLTLLFQVIPVFFLVAGFGGAVSWRGRSGRWHEWFAHRLTGVLGPVTGYVLVVLGVVVVLRLSGVDPGQLRYGAWAVALHLWFLPVYLGLVAATPVLVAADRRWRPTVPVVLTLVVVLLDVTARSTWAGATNYLLGWAVPYQLGIAWQAGALRPRRAVILAVAGVLALTALVWAGPYPVSMIGVPGADIHNTSPPTPALVAFAVAQAGILVAAAPALAERLRARRAPGAANDVVLGVYLWHMVPVVVAAVLLYPAGLFPQPSTGSVHWWLSRIPWLGVLTALMGLLVAALRAVRVRPGRRGISLRGPWCGAVLLTGTALIAYALVRFAAGGFAPGGGIPVVTSLLYLGGAGLVALVRPIPTGSRA